jgi:hypothetical protein
MIVKLLENTALGTTLCTFSAFMHYGVREVIVYPGSFYQEVFMDLKKIFSISDNILKINTNYNDPCDYEFTPSDVVKVGAPYYKVSTPKKYKGYIGLVCYPDTPLSVDSVLSDNVFNEPSDDFPEFKLYSLEKYAELYKFLKKTGWDVITFDNKKTPLCEKIELLANQCEIVVGYEGGLAHLCHILDIPYIMLPWRKPTNNIAHQIHLDNKTYFLNSFDEIFEWSSEKFQQIIHLLNSGQGNNEFLHYSKEQLLDTVSQWVNISNSEKEFLLQQNI